MKPASLSVVKNGHATNCMYVYRHGMCVGLIEGFLVRNTDTSTLPFGSPKYLRMYPMIGVYQFMFWPCVATNDAFNKTRGGLFSKIEHKLQSIDDLVDQFAKIGQDFDTQELIETAAKTCRHGAIELNKSQLAIQGGRNIFKF